VRGRHASFPGTERERFESLSNHVPVPRTHNGRAADNSLPLIVGERLREQQAEGIKMPDGMPMDELALRVLVAAETGRIPHLGD
jgi:hypothetical protein